jgi:membrane protease subunit HflK
MKWFAATLIAATVAYLATGVYTVGTDQRAVVRRFGGVIDEHAEPGLHLGLPWGLDRVDLVKPSETKTVQIGGRATDRAIGPSLAPSLAQFLTGDQNLVNVEATVQYTITDPTRYLFSLAEPAQVITRAAESATSTTLASKSIDSVLTSGKDALAILIKDTLEQNLRPYELGVQIRSVSLTELAPPPQVADAFTRAASARSDRERLVLEAGTYANEKLAQARSESQQRTDRARADHARAVDLARSEAERFAGLLYEYRKAPAVAAARMYLEAIAEIVPRFRSKLIIDRGQGVDLTIMRDEP